MAVIEFLAAILLVAVLLVISFKAYETWNKGNWRGGGGLGA